MDTQDFLERRGRAMNNLINMLQVTDQISPYSHQLAGADYLNAIERTRRENGRKAQNDDNKNRPIRYMIEGLRRCEDSNEVWKWINAYFSSHSITLTPECFIPKESGGGMNWKVIFELASKSHFEHSYRIAEGLHAVYREFWK